MTTPLNYYAEIDDFWGNGGTDSNTVLQADIFIHLNNSEGFYNSYYIYKSGVVIGNRISDPTNDFFLNADEAVEFYVNRGDMITPIDSANIAANTTLYSLGSRDMYPVKLQQAKLAIEAEIPVTFDDLTDGTTNKAYTATEKTKLSGVATGATANSSDAALLSRVNHTGTQSADTITDGTTNKAYTATERTKLSGIATGATANSADATLLNRANHTGTQAASTITGLATVATSGSYTDLSNKPALPKTYTLVSGTPTLRSSPVDYMGSANVSSGTIVLYLTTDGTSTGTALFPNGIDYMKAEVSNSSASFNYGYALTNSNKTLTITVNTVSVTLGLLSFNSAANGSTVSVLVKGY